MSLLADPDGEISQEIFDDFKTCYGELFDLSIKLKLPEIKREVYFTLPANTSVVFPSQLGVVDFSEPTRIWERGGLTTVTVSATVDGTPIKVTTIVPHGRATNDRVELNGIQGVPGWVNRDWLITVVDSLNFTLNGSILAGAPGTGGSVMFSRDRFSAVNPADTMNGGQDPRQTLGVYLWEEGALWFVGSTEIRQLKIEYLATSDAPPSGVIGYANGRELNFLKYATAARFAPKRGVIMGPQYKLDAYGPSGEPDGSGGYLRALILPPLLQKQTIVRKPMRYHKRRGMIPGFR